ncbi:hypothetical protein PTKIN_Ptkin14bG0215100 [Pterospermum kingtungense]
MATRLALVSLHEWMLNVSPYLGVKVTNSQAIGDSLFKSTAQFILHTFDMEDFERFNSHDKLEAEYKKFWKELSSYLEEDFEGFTTYDKLKSKHTLSWKYNVESEIPHNLVANGKISLDDFPSLREQDVGYILTSCAYSNGAAILMDFGWPYDVLPCFKEGCHDRFVEMARTILLQYIPREEDVKMYSILGCGRTLDAIREEAFSNIDQILELGKSDEIVAQSFKGFLASMIKRRYCILKYLCMFASYGLRAQTFGSFAKEVIELVEIADLRRRYLSHHFISKHQILWAVSLTEFKDLVDILVKDIGLKDVVEKPATHPPYNIYITARTIADIHGDYVAGVDHLVVATIFQMSKRRLRKNIIEFNNIPCVKKFIEAVREYKRKYQEHLIMVNSWDNEYLDDRSSDISSNAELGDDVDTELDDDAELDDDTELDDYCLEYVNKSKIKNLRKRKKDKNYEWGGSIRSRERIKTLEVGIFVADGVVLMWMIRKPGGNILFPYILSWVFCLPRNFDDEGIGTTMMMRSMLTWRWLQV